MNALSMVLMLVLGLLVSGGALRAEEVEVTTALEGPPTQFLDEQGKLSGFSVDVVRAIQHKLKDQTPISIYPWARLYRRALAKPNIVLFTVSRNASREPHFHWITPLTSRRSEFFATSANPVQIDSLADAKAVRSIGVLRGGNREQYLKQQGFLNLSPSDDESQNLKQLMSGRIDLIFMSRLEAAALIRQTGGAMSELIPVFPVYSNDSYIALSKNGTTVQTREHWERAARQLKSDGTFERIAARWSRRILETYGVETEVRGGLLRFWKE